MQSERDNSSSTVSDLRYRGETSVRWTGVHERRKVITPEEARRMLHELQVQNEELRRIQSELDAARARYFDLYDLAPVGYCTVSDTKHILEANLTAATLLGMSCSELVGNPIQRFILASDQDIYDQHCKRLVETGLPQSCELRLIKPDGSQFWAQLSATQIQGATRHTALRLVLTDIDERKVAQDRIRISELALKAISQGVLITTPQLRVVSVNEAFLSMTGYTERELIGVDCSLFNGPLTDRTTTTKLVRAIKEKREFSGQLLNYRKDGSSFWNELAISPVVDDQGRLSHFISINTDVSERKRLDQALLENNLALQQATFVAEKANHSKSEFLSSMSHELRSPLNAILGFAQLLETGTPVLAPAQQDKTEKIQRAGWYLLKLINDILDLGLIESGKLALTLTPLSLARVLLECQSMIEPLAERHAVRVDFPQVASQLLVLADPVRLQQVIINLLSNAVKYNRSKGNVHVTVDNAAVGVLRIGVHDTGEGMSEEKLSHLFEPFNRLGQEGSTTEGTGIGLVVTRRLTELMGGRIRVQSTVGVGSVFWVELSEAQALPAVKDAVTCLEEAAQLPAPARPGSRPCTVLYVEDNLANMELVAQILALGRPHFQLLRAQSGTQGMELARSHCPQVILMDLNLPGISGLEALRSLRQDPATRHIPVLAISANAMPQDIANGLAAGFFYYLTKPFKIEEFLKVLDQALAIGSTESHCPGKLVA